MTNGLWKALTRWSPGHERAACSSAIPGARAVAQREENAAAAELDRLTADAARFELTVRR